MKKFITFILAFILIFSMVWVANSDNDVATPTDLQPIEPSVPDEPPVEPPTDQGPPVVNYTVDLNNLNQFGIVALHDCSLQSHMRNSIWVGGTLTGPGYEINIDDATSWSGAAGHNSYVYNNQGNFIFKGRSNARGADAYYKLDEAAITATINYWYTVYRNLGTNNETCIYVPASADGTAYIHGGENNVPRYICPDNDESIYDGPSITYWTDAKKVEVRDVCGFVIAPASHILLLGNNRVSVVGNSVEAKWGETHINDKTPTIIEPTPSPTPDPTPTPKPITVTKKLKGEIWQVRCDVMDNTTFVAGGGYWKADITNVANITSKEGHRSNHCGNKENWVLFVNEEGKAISLYQLKSGSTGGTLPSIVYRAPADLTSIPESQLIYDPTDPNDAMTARLINEVFRPENAMSFSEINLQEGQRLFWISQNGKQVWHHTGVLKKTHPKFAIIINGVPYSLGVGDSITLTDVEVGLLEIEEIATANYKLQAVEYDADNNVVVINEIDPPDKPTPTPPPPIITPTPTPTPTGETPTPTPTPTPTVTITPTPTPTVTVTPSPTPVTYCSIKIIKKVDQYETMESAIFYFKITGASLNEPIYVEITVDPETGIGSEIITGLKAGKYTVEEIDIPEGYIILSDESITKYYREDGGEAVFENQFITPSPSPTPTPTPTPIPVGSFRIYKKAYVPAGETKEFTFQVEGPSFEEEPLIVNIDVHESGSNHVDIENVIPGIYTITEISMADGYFFVEAIPHIEYDGDQSEIKIIDMQDPEITPVPQGIIVEIEEGSTVGKFGIDFINATPTPSPTITPSPRPTSTPTITPVVTVTPTQTVDPTPTQTPTPTVTPAPTPYTDEEGKTWVYDPTPTQAPNTGKKPKSRGDWHTTIDEYDTALGVGTTINHVGDCFD